MAKIKIIPKKRKRVDYECSYCGGYSVVRENYEEEGSNVQSFATIRIELDPNEDRVERKICGRCMLKFLDGVFKQGVLE